MAGGRVADQIGRVLGGRYRLLAPVGTGASAHVYLAEDVTLRRRVAVKILQPALAADEAFLRRFRAEAQAAAALNHPHVMRVFDWGEDVEGPFLVLEFLGGGSLRDLLDAGHRLTPSQALLVGIEAARALDHAHRRGLVHRDIKPANILFDEEGRTAIADFGLARALAEAMWTEPDGVLLGTARYAAPEQARGRAVDGKADVYALGLVLLEAVTGDPPPSSDTTVATLMARANQPIIAPFELGPLAAPVDAAGCVDPDDRPDAAGLAMMLDAAARKLPSPAPLPLVGPIGLDALAPSISDPTETGAAVTQIIDTVAVTEPAELSPTKRKRRRVPLILGVLALVGLLAAAAFATIPNLIRPQHIVPTVAGKSLDEARTIASQSKLDIEVTDEIHRDGTVAGQVLSQDPPNGEKLREGEAIKVVVSRGPPLVDFPDLTDKTEAVARERLDAVGLTVGKVLRQFSEEKAKDVVLSWSPNDQRQLPKGASVDLVVSDGPAPRAISDWKGKTFEEAKRGLELSEFKVERVDVFSETVEAGRVVSTNPGAGQKAPYRSTVKVNVSKGPEEVVVPDVTRKTVGEASAILTAAGLKVGEVLQPKNGQGKVFFTNPAAGSKVKRGTAVTLYAN
ncbi:MAG TPA: PASTA domain-containing protein [Acidimicrobiales bacterium]|nr:PASTA domain-containing protein [Acidimicrobiales bacterium]